MTTATASGNGFRRFARSIHIPPVYYILILIFLVGGLLDQIFADGQIFKNPAIMLNIVVRSVALGIVAVGQTLVITGASIDLSVAYTSASLQSCHPMLCREKMSMCPRPFWWFF